MDDSSPLAAHWDIGFHLLLMLFSGCPKTLEVDQGGSLGAKKGDADLDYEIVDRAGEHTPQPLQPPHHPWAGLAVTGGEVKTGIFRESDETPQFLSRGWAERSELDYCPALGLWENPD